MAVTVKEIQNWLDQLAPPFAGGGLGQRWAAGG